MPFKTDELSFRYQQVCQTIAEAARKAGRNPEEVRLVVVTKGHPPQAIQALYDLGVRHIGENRIEEALNKMSLLQPLAGLEWHMIGHLQSRKAKQLGSQFALLHSLDRLKLARKLEQSLADTGEVLPVLLQFNVSGEATKSGWEATSESEWPSLLPEIGAVLQSSHLQVRGLMTMAPYTEDPEESRPHFARLRRLRDFLSKHFPDHQWDQLSMGMSGDYQVAVEEGATLLRVGTAIMGALY